MKIIISCSFYSIALRFPPTALSPASQTVGGVPNKYASFEYHAVIVSAPVKVSVIVIPSPGQIGNLVDELDTLLFSVPECGCPLLILGDLNIHLEHACVKSHMLFMSTSRASIRAHTWLPL